MRILALGEIADDWAEAVAEWRGLNAPLVSVEASKRAPTTNHEYMLYQTLIGAWPFEPIDGAFIERIQAYAIKAAREGKRSTSWTDPQESYEKRLTEFAGNILDRERSAAFIESITGFARRTSLLGALNSLSQLTLKLTLPGVPDFYQGTELWDLSLVDPDNRRPVDFDQRRTLVSEASDWPELVAHWHDGRIKMQLMRRLLDIRHDFAALFRDGGYTPLAFEGADADRVIGFTRTHKRRHLLVIVGRHFSAHTGGGRHWLQPFDVRIAGEDVTGYRDLLGSHPAQGLFGSLPALILVRP
jgi:(1->4)-alpha-D-glucan 1-alpha-D-glucosylmutase